MNKPLFWLSSASLLFTGFLSAQCTSPRCSTGCGSGASQGYYAPQPQEPYGASQPVQGRWVAQPQVQPQFGGYVMGSGPHDEFKTEKDGEILHKLREAFLNKHDTDSRAVLITVIDEKAVLRGAVPSNKDSKDLEALAKSLRVAKSVDNKIAIDTSLRKLNPQSGFNQGASNQHGYFDQHFTADAAPVVSKDYMATADSLKNDREIAKKVKDSLSGGILSKGYDKVQYDVINGVVVLRGDVDTEKDKQNVHESVSKIDGVRRVDNQIRVAQPSTNKQWEVRMNEDIIKGKWKDIKGQVKEKWGKLTDDDMKIIEGKRDQLIGKIQERYGYQKERAEEELKNFENTYKERLKQR